MSELRRIRLWIRALVRPRTVERELTLELRHHIELETEKNIRAGMTPADARRKAMLDFGGEERFKEQSREARATRPLEDVLLDIRYGLRQLRKHPGFTVVALLSLALGIGANTAIFSVVNTVLLRPLPFADPEGLVVVEEHAYAAFVDATGYRTGSVTLTGGSIPERLRSYSVTANFFQAFGVDPVMGRFFEPTPEEDRAGKMVVLSHRLWQNRFGGDPGIVGRSLSLNGEPHTVLGVAPADLRSARSRATTWPACGALDTSRRWPDWRRVRPWRPPRRRRTSWPGTWRRSRRWRKASTESSWFPSQSPWWETSGPHCSSCWAPSV